MCWVAQLNSIHTYFLWKSSWRCAVAFSCCFSFSESSFILKKTGISTDIKIPTTSMVSKLHLHSWYSASAYHTHTNTYKDSSMVLTMLHKITMSHTQTMYLASFMAVVSAICHWACLSCFSRSRWPCVASSAWLLCFCCSSRTSSSSLVRSWACNGGEGVGDWTTMMQHAPKPLPRDALQPQKNLRFCHAIKFACVIAWGYRSAHE